MSFIIHFLEDIFGANSPDIIGKRGEVLTARKLGWINFCGMSGKLLQNAYIPKPDGTTAEIDLLYITVKGIFVIESKNYSGYIFGNDKSPKWTATLYAGKDWLGRKLIEKHQFYNPIWQNQSHIRFLKQFLGEDIQTISLIVFSERCELKSIEISPSDLAICNRDQLPNTMKRIWSDCPDVLSQAKIEEVYNKLLPLTNVDEALKQQHIQSINNKYNSIDVCPWCGAKLILRTAKSGINLGKQFYGCSNFPNCRYTKKIE